jgi:hypothetical protein
MSVRSFHSVFMATAVAGAALGCYLVSLRVASERAALESVESQIVSTQSSIRLLQTEVGTRSRLSQLERWNVSALSLSAPNAGQILGDKFQLARLVEPEHRPAVEAPVVLAAAPAPQPQQPLAQDGDPGAASGPQLLHEASYEVADKAPAPSSAKPLKAEPKPIATKAPAEKTLDKAVASKAPAKDKKAGDKSAKADATAVTKPVHTAKVDPLAPLPAPRSSGTRTQTNR